jgi:hypothetical protein
VAPLRKGADVRTAALDAKAAQRAAEQVDEDGAYRVDYACAAIEAAHYALFDAGPVHRHADKRAQA